MDCEHLNKVSLWMDDELSPEMRAELDSHLSGCEVCSRARDEFMSLRQELQSIEPKVDPFARRRALERILGGSHRSFWAWRVPVPAPVLVSVAIGFVLVAGVALWPSPEPPGILPVAPASAGSVDLSRYDRGQRAVLYKIPRPTDGTVSR